MFGGETPVSDFPVWKTIVSNGLGKMEPECALTGCSGLQRASGFGQARSDGSKIQFGTVSDDFNHDDMAANSATGFSALINIILRCAEPIERCLALGNIARVQFQKGIVCRFGFRCQGASLLSARRQAMRKIRARDTTQSRRPTVGSNLKNTSWTLKQ